MMVMTTVNQCKLIGSDHTQERLAGKIAHAHQMFQGKFYLSVLYAFLEGDQDRGKVLCYDGQTWTVVFQADLLSEDEGFFQTSEALYSSMVVFQTSEDPAPCLYVSLVSAVGALLLRSSDGQTFEMIKADSLGTAGLLGVRKLIALDDQMAALMVGTTETDATSWAELPSVYATADPKTIPWSPVSTAKFGKSTNEALSDLALFDQRLFAATVNREEGFEFWEATPSPAAATGLFPWSNIFIRGGSRYILNQLVADMEIFQGSLYLVTGISPVSLLEAKEFSSVCPEVLRVNPDNSWDLIVGAPRFTPYGLRVPLGTLGPGFDEPTNTRLSFIVSHKDCLYVGTQGFKGFQMWSSPDGETWAPVELEGVRQKKILGAASTPFGLVLVLDIGTEQHTTGLEVWLAG